MWKLTVVAPHLRGGGIAEIRPPGRAPRLGQLAERKFLAGRSTYDRDGPVYLKRPQPQIFFIGLVYNLKFFYRDAEGSPPVDGIQAITTSTTRLDVSDKWTLICTARCMYMYTLFHELA